VDPELFAGRYRLESLLGQSVMSEVWLAHDSELERPVALKLLTPDADRSRFDREARAAASLAHPNVTHLYDYGEADGRLFIALEYLPGGTLEDRLGERQPLADAETKPIAAQLAAGLAHAHARGLVHRDVKPANVLFDEEGRPKLADFGIARITGGDTITEAGTVMGTATYISPEQAAGEPAGPASDVYSFGVLLYRLLTGRLPFESDSPLELARMHRELEPPAIELVRPDAPPELAAVAKDALAKDPRRRPPDGAALAARLGAAPEIGAKTEEAAAATVVIPRPVARRRRASTPLLAAALILVGAAGVAAGILATRPGSSHAPATPPSVTAQANTSSGSTAASVQTTTSSPSTATTGTSPATTSQTSTSVPSTTATTVPTTTVPPSTAATTTPATTGG
jgi:serine/threonine protein kinase